MEGFLNTKKASATPSLGVDLCNDLQKAQKTVGPAKQKPQDTYFDDYLIHYPDEKSQYRIKLDSIVISYSVCD
jgi:hypothetical protein